VLAALGALAGAAFIAPATSHVLPAPPPAKVAIIDVFHALENLAEFRDRNVEFEAKGKAFSDNLKKLNDEIKQIETELDTAIPATDIKRRAEKIAQAIEFKATLEARGSAFKQLIELEQGDVVHGMYVKLVDAVKALAEKEGLDLVLFDDRRAGPKANAAFTENRRQIENRQILYASPALDYTDRLVTVMNNDYAAGGKK